MRELDAPDQADRRSGGHHHVDRQRQPRRGCVDIENAEPVALLVIGRGLDQPPVRADHDQRERRRTKPRRHALEQPERCGAGELVQPDHVIRPRIRLSVARRAAHDSTPIRSQRIASDPGSASGKDRRKSSGPAGDRPSTAGPPPARRRSRGIARQHEQRQQHVSAPLPSRRLSGAAELAGAAGAGASDNGIVTVARSRGSCQQRRQQYERAPVRPMRHLREAASPTAVRQDRCSIEPSSTSAEQRFGVSIDASKASQTIPAAIERNCARSGVVASGTAVTTT